MVNNERKTSALHIKDIIFSLNRMDGYFSTLHSLLLSLFLCIKFYGIIFSDLHADQLVSEH